MSKLENLTWTRHTVGEHLQRVPRQLARGRVAGQGAQFTVQISGWIQAEVRATTTRQRNRTFLVRMWMIWVVSFFQ